MAKVFIKSHSPSLVIREMQMKNSEIHYALRKINIKTIDNALCWCICGANRNLILSLQESKIVKALWKKIVTVSYKTKHMPMFQHRNSTPRYLPNRTESICPQKD